MDKYKKQNSVFTSEFSTFPFPTRCETHWSLQVPPWGARAEQEHSTDTSTKPKKNSWESKKNKGNLDIE